MSEVVAPVPAAGSPAAQPVRPTAPVVAAPTPAPSQTPEEFAQLKAENARLLSESKSIELKKREQIVERRKWQSERNTMGERLKEADEYAKLKREAKMNPSATLQRLYGDKWYDEVVNAKLNGGAPTADVVALEIEKVEERWQKKLDERDERDAVAREAAQVAQTNRALGEFQGQVFRYLKQSAEEFPLIGAAFGDESRAATTLTARIRSHFEQTKKVLTMKEAAESLENDLLAVVEKGAGLAKYADRIKTKLTPAPASGVNGGPKLQQPSAGQHQPQRITLSNDLTGTTPGRKPAVSDEDRRQRAIDAFNASRKST